MNRHHWALGLFTAASVIATQQAGAIELAGGRTAFIRPPQFIEASTTRNYVMRRNATYFFTLEMPSDADASLQSVVIAPQNLTRHLRPYHLEETVAFAESSGEARSSLDIRGVSIDEETKAVTVDFDPPVAPGQLVTIGLRPTRNPRLDGTYVFRVTAVPVGDRPQAHIAGHGRLNFIDNDRGRIYD